MSWKERHRDLHRYYIIIVERIALFMGSEANMLYAVTSNV